VTSIGQKCQHFVTKNLVRVANLFLYLFMHLRKFRYFFIFARYKFRENL
jgi:hypothetical protein